MPETDAQKCADVIDKIRNPLTCWKLLMETTSEVGESEAVPEHEGANAHTDVCQSELEKFKSGFNRATGSLIELLAQLMMGHHLEDCKELAKSEVKISEAVSQAVRNSHQSQQSSDSVTDLIKTLCTVVQSFESSHKSIVSGTSSSCPAPSLLSTLNAAGENEDTAAKREHVWKQVQAERRKWVTFSIPKSYTSKDHLSSSFRSCGKVFGHTGQLNANHRLIVASADLLSESATEPWIQQSQPDKTAWKAISDFSSSSSGATDFCILFDGRMKEVRKMNDSRNELGHIFF